MSASSRSPQTTEVCPACRSTNTAGSTCLDCGTMWGFERVEYDAPSEPDWEQIAEDRAWSRFDEDAAQDRYDNSVYGP